MANVKAWLGQNPDDGTWGLFRGNQAIGDVNRDWIDLSARQRVFPKLDPDSKPSSAKSTTSGPSSPQHVFVSPDAQAMDSSFPIPDHTPTPSVVGLGTTVPDIAIDIAVDVLPDGWREVVSKSREGEAVSESIHTLERQAWRPTAPAVTGAAAGGRPTSGVGARGRHVVKHGHHDHRAGTHNQEAHAVAEHTGQHVDAVPPHKTRATEMLAGADQAVAAKPPQPKQVQAKVRRRAQVEESTSSGGLSSPWDASVTVKHAGAPPAASTEAAVDPAVTATTSAVATSDTAANAGGDTKSLTRQQSSSSSNTLALLHAAILIQKWHRGWKARRVITTFKSRQAMIHSHFGKRDDCAQQQAKMIEDIEANDPRVTVFEMINTDHFTKMAKKNMEAEFVRVGKALATNKHVTKVWMVHVGGTDALAVAIAGALAANPRIVDVNLETNSIGGAGIMALAAALLTTTTVEKIKLADQKAALPTDALVKLTEAIVANPCTTTCTVDLREKAMIHTMGKAIRDNVDSVRKARHAKNVAAGKGPKLTGLKATLDGLDLSVESSLDLTDSQEFKSLSTEWQTERFAACIAKNCSLTKIKMCGLGLKDNFAVAFAAAAFACPTLREIDFTRNAIAGPGVIAICRALPGSSMVVVKLNNNKPPGTEAEAAASEAIKACTTITKLTLDWKNQQHQSACDRTAMQNADRARKARAAAKNKRA